MKAVVGDRIVVRGHKVGDPVRHAEILDVLGDNGEMPYKVRWDDDGHVSTYFPGTDAFVEHLGAN